MSRNPLRNTRRTHKVFFEHNGRSGPWPCHFCNEPVLNHGMRTWDGNVHHLDEDVANDTPENLAMSHVICHQHAHPVSPEMAAQISAKLKGRPSPTKGMRFSAEVNAKKSHPSFWRGKTMPEEIRRKMRGSRRRMTCTECGCEYALNWINRHKTEGRCT